MPHFRVAQVRRIGVELLIVPMAPAFGRQTPAAQTDLVNELQAQAVKAELPGAVVPVWEHEPGRLRFLARPELHPALKGLSVARLRQMLNRDLSW